MSRLSRVVGGVFCVLVCATTAIAQIQDSDRVDRALRGEMRGGARTQKVIISVRRGYRTTLKQTLEAHGDLIKSEHESIDALAVDIHASDIEVLSHLPWVESIALDANVFAIGGRDRQNGNGPKGDDQRANDKGGSYLSSSPLIDTHLRETLGLEAVAAGNSPQGRGVVVAVVDSGIQPSADLDPSRIVAFYDLTRPGCAKTARQCAAIPFDDHGHGTHVAGLIGSAGVLSGGLYQGVAPRVRFAGFKVLTQNGSGQTSDVIAALEYISANRVRLGVKVINLSLGHDITMPAILDPLVRAVERASAKGLIVVVAAGNNPRDSLNKYAGVTSPANAPSALTVGAADTHNTTERTDDNVAEYSGRGPTFFDGLAKPDFVAPGSHLISNIALGDSPDLLYNYSTLATGRVTLTNGSRFMRLSGTSMSAAVASGVTALVLEANRNASDTGAPTLSPNAVKAILQYTAIPIENVLTGFEPYTLVKTSPDVLTQGAGGINAKGAIALAAHIDTTTSLGQRWLTGFVAPSSVIGGVDYLWSRNIIWGTSVLGGDILSKNLLLWSHNIIWGTNIVWGTDRGIVRTALDGDNIIWGTLRNLLRAQNIIWGTRLVAGKPTLYIAGNSRTRLSNILWGTSNGPQVRLANIIWGTAATWITNLVAGRVIGVDAGTDGENILWGTDLLNDQNILWGTGFDGEGVVWGTYDESDNILWGTWEGNNILWGTSGPDRDNIVWGTTVVEVNNIVWGTIGGGRAVVLGAWDGDDFVSEALDNDDEIWSTAIRPETGF